MKEFKNRLKASGQQCLLTYTLIRCVCALYNNQNAIWSGRSDFPRTFLSINIHSFSLYYVLSFLKYLSHAHQLSLSTCNSTLLRLARWLAFVSRWPHCWANVFHFICYSRTGFFEAKERQKMPRTTLSAQSCYVVLLIRPTGALFVCTVHASLLVTS